MTQPQLGVVVIGRNEGERLQRCLTSLSGAGRLVYVDSGSSDGSVAFARSVGAEVVELDMSTPFSAARARNAGFERLGAEPPIFVQFVDGDCEIQPGWLERAARALTEDPTVALVAGRRRERFPDESIYNQLCDIEWDTPVGEAGACGGDFLIRAAVFRAVGGFNPTVIAGEEPEMCLRVRHQGHRIFRLDQEMTLHDAAMTRFSQWWKRAERAGYAYALVASLHARGPERLWLRQVISVLVWALWAPVTLLAAAFVSPLCALGLGVYPLLAARIYVSLRKRRGLEPRPAFAYALACVVGKFAECVGVLRCARDLALGRDRKIIEYKHA